MPENWPITLDLLQVDREPLNRLIQPRSTLTCDAIIVSKKSEIRLGRVLSLTRPCLLATFGVHQSIHGKCPIVYPNRYSYELANLVASFWSANRQASTTLRLPGIVEVEKVSLTASDLPLPSYASKHTRISVREEITTCPRDIIDLLLKDLSAGTLQAREDEARRLWQSFIDEAESHSEAQSIGSSGSSVACVANAQAEIPLEGVDREATLSADESWEDGKYGADMDADELGLQSENGPPSDAELHTETGDMMNRSRSRQQCDQTDCCCKCDIPGCCLLCQEIRDEDLLQGQNEEISEIGRREDRILEHGLQHHHNQSREQRQPSPCSSPPSMM